jgi:hypothetical protein
MAEFQTVDDFLNHKGNEPFGLKNLKGWAKSPGYLHAWLHTRQVPVAVWLHRIPEKVIRKDKDNRERELVNVWGRQHVCWEDETILKKQRMRVEGRREFPPQRCGVCRLIEKVRELMLSHDLADTDVLFKFEGSDKPEENTIIHAGGLANVWKRDMKEEDKERLKKHGIYMGNSGNKMGAWSENMQPKLNYVFALVNHDSVQDGLQVATQTEVLGKKVQNLIKDEILSKDDLGNPFLHPYCIRFQHKPEEKAFDDKYHVLRMDKNKLTPEIEKIIRSDKPDIRRFTKRYNQRQMRATLEAHATELGKRLPWDEIFNVPGYKEDEEETKPQETRTPEVGHTAAAPPNTIPCDDCKHPMLETETVCGKCGAKYEDDGAAPAASPPKEESFGDAVYVQGGDSDVPF